MKLLLSFSQRTAIKLIIIFYLLGGLVVYPAVSFAQTTSPNAQSAVAQETEKTQVLDG